MPGSSFGLKANRIYRSQVESLLFYRYLRRQMSNFNKCLIQYEKPTAVPDKGITPRGVKCCGGGRADGAFVRRGMVQWPGADNNPGTGRVIHSGLARLPASTIVLIWPPAAFISRFAYFILVILLPAIGGLQAQAGRLAIEPLDTSKAFVVRRFKLPESFPDSAAVSAFLSEQVTALQGLAGLGKVARQTGEHAELQIERRHVLRDGRCRRHRERQGDGRNRPFVVTIHGHGPISPCPGYHWPGAAHPQAVS